MGVRVTLPGLGQWKPQGNCQASCPVARARSGGFSVCASLLAILISTATVPAGLSAQTSMTPQTPAQSPAPSPAQPARTWQWTLTNLTRIESWHFFEPPPAGGDPDYALVANRFRFGVSRTWLRFDLNAAAQYVQFGGLPTGAVGPGPLGTGALYYDHSGRTTSRQIYLRTINVAARLPRGVRLQAGRFGYTSGSESSSGRQKVEAVKRARVDSRLIGEFEWSLYQRAFDGVRGDVDRKRWHLTAAWLRPTQGGFEESAGASLSGIDVAVATMTLRPDVLLPATDLALFAAHYDDDRPVSARPDNTGLSTSRVDVAIPTFGASAVGSTSAGRGDADWLAWFAGQAGSWYGQPHRAWSLAIEAGYQWKTRWQPWVRAGYLHASGDPDAADARHGTFFPMLPTVRKYSFTTAYAPMNLRDAFAEVILRPSPRATVRADVRRLDLAEAADRWYAGSGATQQRGTSFGYAGRRSGGATELGTVIEGAADVAVARRWSVNGFVGVIHGGAVVRSVFAGDWLRFLYLESVLQF
ncbi:MAG: hypothetical protein A3J29_09680 [Acidobacteria bacterium RIFCSPLOWO2_12_FULL_67_14b]|nr:MAG: hypothetical protein A3J29_09680 [Acidobacteria bacterium RIFCSPLOWO2_12_FULL_67_14b]